MAQAMADRHARKLLVDNTLLGIQLANPVSFFDDVPWRMDSSALRSSSDMLYVFTEDFRDRKEGILRNLDLLTEYFQRAEEHFESIRATTSQDVALVMLGIIPLCVAHSCFNTNRMYSNDTPVNMLLGYHNGDMMVKGLMELIHGVCQEHIGELRSLSPVKFPGFLSLEMVEDHKKIAYWDTARHVIDQTGQGVTFVTMDDFVAFLRRHIPSHSFELV